MSRKINRQPSDDEPDPSTAESGGEPRRAKRRPADEEVSPRAQLALHLQQKRAEKLVEIATRRIDGAMLRLGERGLIEPHAQFVAQLRRLFRKTENVTVIKKFKAEEKRVRPDGLGVTRNRDEWIRDAEATGKVPEGVAGAWFVINPTDRGELTNDDVTDYRHLLVENDVLPLNLQLAVLQALPLPILAITSSGRKSYHAIVEVNAGSATEYALIATQILGPLKELGFDSSCRNPSRLSRLAGATRHADVRTPSAQSLIYLRPADAPPEGIGGAIKDLRDLIMLTKEHRLAKATGNGNYYYDSSSRLYWMRNSRGGLITVDEKSMSRALAVEHGLSRKSEGGGSEVEHALHWIQSRNDVMYAGPLAGYREGIHEDGGRRLLITEGPRLITPQEGSWPHLGDFFERMFDVDGVDQRPYVFGWLKSAMEALRQGIRRPGQVLALSGPVGAGKSLFQGLVTEMLGGRCERAFTYLASETGFNGELFRAEHLILEDELASRDMRSRRRLGAAFKGIVANELQRCRRMRCEGVGLRPFWRVTVSLNEAPEDLLVLPPLDDGIRDKIMLIAVNRGLPPLPVNSLEERSALRSGLVRELPAFLAHLESWQMPPEIQDQRYGVRQFHHPRILVALRELAPEQRFLEIIDAVLFRGGLDDFLDDDDRVGEGPWQGTAMDLERRLLRSDFKREVEGLLSFNNASGTFLRRLEQEPPHRVVHVTIRGRRVWRIMPPPVPQDKEDRAEVALRPALPNPPEAQPDAGRDAK